MDLVGEIKLIYLLIIKSNYTSFSFKDALHRANIKMLQGGGMYGVLFF